MKTWSQFVAYMAGAKRDLPRRAWEQARREGLALNHERLARGYGAAPLDFSDIIARAEASIELRGTGQC